MILAITAIGANRPDAFPELMQVISESRCVIVESRVTVFARQFAGHWYVDGNWNHIAKLENGLAAVASRRGLKLTTSRVDDSAVESDDVTTCLPYTVDVVSAERVGIVYDLTGFLLERNIEIREVATSTYTAPYTDASLFSAHLTIGIPAETRLVSLRDEFLDFCDREHLDAILEPVKR